MKCDLCTDQRDIPIIKENIVEHLIITKDKFGTYHIHGPLENKTELLTMIAVLCRDTDINLRTHMEPKVKAVPVTKKHLENKMLSTEQKRLKRQYGTSLSYDKRVA